MNRIIKFILIFLGLIILILLFNYKKLIRLNKVNHLFDKEVIGHNFQNIAEIAEVSKLRASNKPLVLPKLSQQLPQEVRTKNGTVKVSEFLAKTETEGLLIIHKDTIIHEWYGLDLQPDEQHISWSMSKSFIGTMIGIIVDLSLIHI